MLQSNSTLNKVSGVLPQQMIPLSEKNTDDWKQKCMDALEYEGLKQYRENRKLTENYQMIKGKFIYQHYFEEEGYADYIGMLTEELSLPTYLRHYDIISQVINSLSGEQQSRSNILRVRSHDENAQNQYSRDKTKMLQDYVNNQINTEIQKKLLDMGLDPEKKDFSSPEEMQQYQQQVQQEQQALTPPEIEQYMQTSWFTTAEMWGEHQLKIDRDRFALAEKEKEEFEDMLVADRCFRHFYITSSGYSQETWNPIHTFVVKSQEIKEVENGDAVGRSLYMSVNQIIDRYGFMMTSDEIQMLKDGINTKANNNWGYAKGTDYLDDYMTPYEGYYDFSVFHQTTGINERGELPKLGDRFFDNLGANERGGTELKKGYFLVTEGYWMSLKKIYKINYVDTQTGVQNIALVDENIVIPDSFTKVSESLKDNNEPNTYVETWLPETWGGIKINLRNGNFNKHLYLNVKPVEFQFKGKVNPYGAKLPVCGVMGFTSRNSESMSVVDLMKPYQIFYNVCINQAYQIAEREIGRFIIMDINILPKLKDWGGKDAWDKAMLVAREQGIIPADTSPANLQGNLAAAGGQFPRDFNFDETSRLVSRLNMAKEFEQFALRQVGFNDYRLGSYASTSTAGGVEQGKNASVNQTEYLFTNFSNYQRRCYDMNLAIAQYVQSQNKDVQIMYTKSDMSRAFIKLTGDDLLLPDLGVYVVNSAEEARKLEQLRQYALQNNTAGIDPVSVTDIITSNSADEIKLKLKEAYKRTQDLQDRDYQLKQQQVQNQKDIQDKQVEIQNQQFYDKLQNNLQVAEAKAGADAINSIDDVPQPPEPTQVKDDSFTKQQKITLDQQKFIADKDFKNKQLALEQQKVEQKLLSDDKALALEEKKLKVVRAMHGK